MVIKRSNINLIAVLLLSCIYTRNIHQWVTIRCRVWGGGDISVLKSTASNKVGIYSGSTAYNKLGPILINGMWAHFWPNLGAFDKSKFGSTIFIRVI